MAASILPKSKVRKNNNISVGYGEVPAIEFQGKTAWGLPGNTFTFCRKEALRMAERLDSLIRANLNVRKGKLL